MLKILVRCAAVAITALIALVAGVYSAAADLDGLPGSDYVASVRFDGSPLSRDQIINHLDTYVDTRGVGVVRVASAPDDFLNKRVAFAFGSGEFENTSIEWFSPTMSGSMRSSRDLGITSLNGVYGFSGTDSQAASFRNWMGSELKADAVLTKKTSVGLLSYALLTVGAWVPMSAAILLLGATILSWYVLRARGREVRIVAGMRLSHVVFADLRSLLGALALPALGTYSIAVVVVLSAGFGRMGFYISTLALFTVALAGFAVVVAVLLAMITLPAVRDIAVRRPPERGSWVISEVLKVAAVIIVAAILPTVSGIVSNASAANSQGATWAAMGDSVTIRIASRPDAVEEASFAGLTRDMAGTGSAMFSMSLSSNTVNLIDDAAAADLEALGFDSIVLTDQQYLEKVNGTGDASWGPVTAVRSMEDLPQTVKGDLIPSLKLWTTDRQEPEVQIFGNTSEVPIVVSGSMAGTLDSNRHPLILVVRDAAKFDNFFLASAVSRGNVVFTNPARLAELVKERDLADGVLSIDRIADLGLYDAQSKQRNAQLGASAVALALLALIVCVAVTAWIFALLRRRRWFVQRTAGNSWGAILMPRLWWELVTASVFGAVMAMSFAVLDPSSVWISGFAPLAYFATTWLIHQWAASTTFRTTLARRG